MCRTLIADMGGHIALDSEPGKGTCVTVHMPLAAREAVAT
jgi:signal transduction histidine kinase